MQTPYPGISKNQAAWIAGIGLLLMTILAIYASFAVFETYINFDDAGTTIKNIQDNLSSFRLGLFSCLLVVILDVLVAWALFYYFREVHGSLSLITAWFRLVYSVIFAVALGNLMDALNLLGGSEYLKVFSTDQLNARIMLSFQGFYHLWDIGFIFFGLHLVGLGYLGFKSEFVPKILGIIVLITGLSYLIDYMGKILSPDINWGISLILGYGELIFMIWLLIWGWRINKKDK